MRSIQFPKYILDMSPQKRSGFSRSRRGPGVIPYTIRAPRSMAMMTFVGTPRLNMGMKPAWDADLLHVSGAATPSMTPVPNFSGCLESLLSSPYDKKVAERPIPGRIPTKKPSNVPLKIGSLESFQSFRDGKSLLIFVFRKVRRTGIPTFLITSEIPKSPMTIGTIPKPSLNVKVP